MTTNLEVKPAVKALMQARELLERRGWCRGAYCDAYGNYCLAGAVRRVMPTYHAGYAEACALLNRAIGSTWGQVDVGVIHWNDQPERTKAEVIAALDRAIALGLGPP